jgi:hypothetical protein
MKLDREEKQQYQANLQSPSKNSDKSAINLESLQMQDLLPVKDEDEI